MQHMRKGLRKTGSHPGLNRGPLTLAVSALPPELWPPGDSQPSQFSISLCMCRQNPARDQPVTPLHMYMCINTYMHIRSTMYTSYIHTCTYMYTCVHICIHVHPLPTCLAQPISTHAPTPLTSLRLSVLTTPLANMKIGLHEVRVF